MYAKAWDKKGVLYMDLNARNIVIFIICIFFLLPLSGCAKNKSPVIKAKQTYHQKKNTDNKGYYIKGQKIKPGEKVRIKIEDMPDGVIVKSKTKK